MGTRGLTVIIKDGKVKLSQCQQYDSYFSETGVDNIIDRERPQFKRYI